MGNLLEQAQNKLEWIDKRADLTDLQKEYVGFMLNKQEKMIALLSGYIYATRGCLSINDNLKAKYFLDAGISDIERNKKIEPHNTIEDCIHYDEAQGRHKCVNSRRITNRCDDVCICFESEEK